MSMPTIAGVIFLSLILFASGCGDEIPDNDRVPEPKVSKPTQEEETTQN